MIIRGAYLAYRAAHTGSWANCYYADDPNFDFELSPDGEIIYRTRSKIANINKSFAKAIRDFILTEMFMDGNNPDEDKEATLPAATANDKKSDKLVAFRHSWGWQYADEKPNTTVIFKVSDAWLIHEFLMNNCSKNIDYPADQIKNIIGEPKNPIQIEQLAIINAEKAKIKERYDAIIDNDYANIENAVNELRKKHKIFEKEQQEAMRKEFEKVEKMFETV